MRWSATGWSDEPDGLCAREAGELGVPTVGVTVAERYQTSRVTAPLSDVGGKRLVTLQYRKSNGAHPELPRFTGAQAAQASHSSLWHSSAPIYPTVL